MGSFKDLTVFKKSFDLSMKIFEISKGFPREERYSLCDQIRRSSRSVSANIAEAYRKRQYPAHFLSKVSDADAENSETMVWLLYALKCEYISELVFSECEDSSTEIGRLLGHMMSNPEKYLSNPQLI